MYVRKRNLLNSTNVPYDDLVTQRPYDKKMKGVKSQNSGFSSCSEKYWFFYEVRSNCVRFMIYRYEAAPLGVDRA
jgi:hypothetical protein